jgi:hypothetical protein
MTETTSDSMLKTVFDALPSMIFVVDDDVRIQEFNAAASDLLDVQRGVVLKQRAGDVLHCVHSIETNEGCGRSSSCKDCVIRNSVGDAFQGKRIVRRRVRTELIRENGKTEVYALVTASPFVFEGRNLVLLAIEDISEIAELYRMIPICYVCGKVRDDRESWMRVEAYFRSGWGVEFSHGLCPDCYKVERCKLHEHLQAGREAAAGAEEPRG